MTHFVIDTNVILAANGAHEELSTECIEACITQLRAISKSGIVVIDDNYRILLEYQRKTNHRKGKGVGDVFLKWLFQNLSNKTLCTQVTLTELTQDQFAEFPDRPDQNTCDPSDRKFIAAANACPSHTLILQASDCKWLDWHAELKKCGLEVVFPCLKDVRRFYENKFPGKHIPETT
jgi:hypothetical protein